MSFIDQPAQSVAPHAVTTTGLADNSVTTAKIVDGTITNSDIANTTIAGAKLVNDTITATQIAANAVTTSELADSSVTSAKIVDGAIVTADVANAAITYGKIQNTAAQRLLGNPSGISAAPAEIPLGSNLEFNGGALRAVVAPTFDNVRISGVASADVNTLDFYHEYSFIPTLAGAGTPGSYTYGGSSTYGSAVRIGNRLFVQGRVLISSVVTGGSGGLRISGLPLAATQQCLIKLVDTVKSTGSTYTDVGGVITPGSTNIELFLPFQTPAAVLLDSSVVQANTSFSFNFSMLVG